MIKDFKFKKSLGQNFLNDDNVLNNIVSSAEIDKDTLVIEIGPGSGALTKKLVLVSMNVICYEIDERLKPILDKELKDYDNVEVIYKDFLSALVLEDIRKYNYKKLYVVANLPYYITTPIINKIINDKINPDKMIIMVQKEVASRFVATPGSKDYNSLTIFLQYHFNVSKLFDVSKNSFIPKPNIDSSVVCFEKKIDKYKFKDINIFYKLIRDSFRFKRKTIKNNLSDYDLNKIESLLKEYNLDLQARAEEISIDIFIKIAEKISE